MMNDQSTASAKELEQLLFLTASAKSSGIQTIGKLTEQQENLQSAEDTIEANEYTLLKAMTVLRSMTWSGVIYNLFNKEEVPTDVIGKQNRMAEEQNMEFQEKILKEHSGASVEMKMSEEEMLNKLIYSVSELCEIGVHMGIQIEQQNETMERIEEKTGRITDHTLAVTLKTAHLTQRIGNANDGFIGSYQFVDDESGYYLSADNADLILVEKEDLSTFFFCYEKQSTLYGLQNAKTLKYLCSTPWGPIKAIGNNYGKKEECHIFFKNEQRGIYFLQANWGTGGWLNKKLTQIPMQIKDNQGEGILNFVTSNLSDKRGLLLLKPVFSGDSQGKEK